MAANSEPNFKSYLVLALGIMLGLIIAGYLVANSRFDNRFVTVRGFDERIVKADTASWKIVFNSAGPSQDTALKSIEDSRNGVITFLKANGFADEEISLGLVKITDKNANQYSNEAVNENVRFYAEASVSLRSNKVDEVIKISQKSIELAKMGISLQSGWGVDPIFEFTGLNTLKPEMIANATKDARKAADQFAKDSGSAVGDIKNASQGYFEISPLDSTSGEQSLHKKVRVVSTIDFFIE